jgi:hypothetical protein
MPKPLEAPVEVRISARLTTIAGQLVDPTTLTLTIKNPAGASVTYTYGVGPEIKREGLGKFYADYGALTPGIYKYKWSSTGAILATASGQFDVVKSST